MAFLRRKGNTFYLVHNVRHDGKVKQLHLAKLGERPRITDDVVRQVSRAYPFVRRELEALREQVNNRVELFDPKSAICPKLRVRLFALSIWIWPICFRRCWMFRMRLKPGRNWSRSFACCIPR